MFFSGDPTNRKRVDLGGRSSKERDRQKLLEQTRLERNRRLWLRRQNSAALSIQKYFRGRKVVKAEHAEVREYFYQTYGKRCENVNRHCFGPDSEFLRQLIFFFDAQNSNDFSVLVETCRLLQNFVRDTGDVVLLFGGTDYSSNHSLVAYRLKRLSFACIQAIHQNRLGRKTPKDVIEKQQRVTELNHVYWRGKSNQMTASETNGGDEGLASSQKNRVKFLCSYGGKILPRPGDGKLKYVGGETRIVAVHGDIKFSELMKKVNSMVEGDMILKFLVIPDELDALVTVKSDEDVKHIVDEYRRLESEGTPKMRAFLFPLSPVVAKNQINHVDPYAIEQRFIEAINGIVRPSSNNNSGRLTPVNPMSNFSISPCPSSNNTSGRVTPINPMSNFSFSLCPSSNNTSGRVTPINPTSNFSISSCSSPKSPSPDASPSPMDPSVWNGNQNQLNRPPMPKVRSSPSLCSLYSLSTFHPQNNNHSNHQVYQSHHRYHQNHQQQQHYNIQSPRTSPGPQDFVRGAIGHCHVPMNPMNPVYSVSRRNLGNGYPACACCHDDSLAYESAGSSR